MPAPKCPVLIETSQGRVPAGFLAFASAQPVEVALALPEKGWAPYRVQFDPLAAAWVVRVIDWDEAA